jgi:hypothetical protein
MTGKNDPIIEELQRAHDNLVELWAPLGTQKARVSIQRPGMPGPEDITQAYIDGLREAPNALFKAITVLRNQDVK